MTQRLAKLNQSVVKTMRIVEILAESKSPVRLIDLSNEVGLSPSTTFRMLNTLVECGYARQEESGSQGYALTMRFFDIGQKIMSNFSLRDLIHPFLTQLCSETGEAGCCACNVQGRVHYIDVVEGSIANHIVIRQQIGSSAHMHCTGSGKLFLSQYTKAEFDEFVSSPLPALTPRTITDPKDLEYELEITRRNGYAIDDEECEVGMRCIAKPVYNNDQRIVAVISLSGPVSRMSKARIEMELLPALSACTEQIMTAYQGTCSVKF